MLFKYLFIDTTLLGESDFSCPCKLKWGTANSDSDDCGVGANLQLKADEHAISLSPAEDKHSVFDAGMNLRWTVSFTQILVLYFIASAH